jgi:hypothetical protein
MVKEQMDVSRTRCFVYFPAPRCAPWTAHGVLATSKTQTPGWFLHAACLHAPASCGTCARGLLHLAAAVATHYFRRVGRSWRWFPATVSRAGTFARLSPPPPRMFFFLLLCVCGCADASASLKTLRYICTFGGGHDAATDYCISTEGYPYSHMPPRTAYADAFAIAYCWNVGEHIRCADAWTLQVLPQWFPLCCHAPHAFTGWHSWTSAERCKARHLRRPVMPAAPHAITLAYLFCRFTASMNGFFTGFWTAGCWFLCGRILACLPLFLLRRSAGRWGWFSV